MHGMHGIYGMCGSDDGGGKRSSSGFLVIQSQKRRPFFFLSEKLETGNEERRTNNVFASCVVLLRSLKQRSSFRIFEIDERDDRNVCLLAGCGFSLFFLQTESVCPFFFTMNPEINLCISFRPLSPKPKGPKWNFFVFSHASETPTSHLRTPVPCWMTSCANTRDHKSQVGVSGLVGISQIRGTFFCKSFSKNFSQL